MLINNPDVVTKVPQKYYIQLVMVEEWIFASICSAFGSGLVFLLYGKCISLVFSSRSQRSRAMRYFLAVYMTVMVLFSTIQTIMISVLSIGSVRPLVFEVGTPYFPPEKAQCTFCDSVELIAQICLSVVNWGMDAFMIWRCMVIYRDLPSFKRTLLRIFGVTIGALSITSGILFLVPWFPPSLRSATIPGWRPVAGPLSFFACVTLFINVTFSSLIAIRLWLHQARLQKLFGPGHGSLYRKIIIVLLESAALVVVANTVLIILLFLFIPAATAVACSVIHVYVAAPLIILFRIHSNRDVATDISNFNMTGQLEASRTKGSRLEPLQFRALSSPISAASFSEPPSRPKNTTK
ncbi:hypothetical protein CVT24_008802 [Panaeolus cyanescens]|uniref:G-protein coupled receptors family 1 profile domain-containing protein n=1 Tax=Panaeolus cyanescens TaxID=181874 RepID=A0A409VET4_9AGAR|nr:hypothetical protein CVT24_008802 [Panaeolus cyanescens]